MTYGHLESCCFKSKTNDDYLRVSDEEKLSSQSSVQEKRRAEMNDIVTIDFQLESNGFVVEPLFDTEGTVSFLLGRGNYLPGLHELVQGMKINEQIENVLLDAGWGERNPELVVKIPKDEKSGMDYTKIKEGTELVMQNGVNCIVSEVTDDYFVIDANPPLAGASYKCSVKLLRIESPPQHFEYDNNSMNDSRYDVATMALGCFWGGELAYMREKGVVGTKVGYTQGHVLNPSYNDVCGGDTGHTEAQQVIYDPEIVSFERLVKLAIERLGDSVYLLDQVGNDFGSQYRHGIYYHSDEQKVVAEKILEGMDGYKTEVKPATIFYGAEDYHQQYLLKGGQSAKKGITSNIRCYG